MISSISSFEISQAVMTDPNIFFSIGASVADAAVVTPTGIETT